MLGYVHQLSLPILHQEFICTYDIYPYQNYYHIFILTRIVTMVMKVLHNMCSRDLPRYVGTRPRACGSTRPPSPCIHIRQITPARVTYVYITCGMLECHNFFKHLGKTKLAYYVVLCVIFYVKGVQVWTAVFQVFTFKCLLNCWTRVKHKINMRITDG